VVTANLAALMVNWSLSKISLHMGVLPTKANLQDDVYLQACRTQGWLICLVDHDILLEVTLLRSSDAQTLGMF